MKKISVNILCSTAITLILLSLFATASGAHFLLLKSVYQSFFVNILIHIGLLFTHKFESSYAVLEWTLDLGYAIAVVVLFGAAFRWYGSVPIGILVVMTMLVYFAGIFLNTIQMHREIQEINALLPLQGGKQNDTCA